MATYLSGGKPRQAVEGKVNTALPDSSTSSTRGIRGVTLADKRLYADEFNELDLIISIVHMSRAHNGSSIKGDRVSAAWTNKKALARTEKKPLGKACPYWLTLINNQYQPIQNAREPHSSSTWRYRVAPGFDSRLLNERGIPVFGSRNGKGSGAWGTSQRIQASGKPCSAWRVSAHAYSWRETSTMMVNL